MRSESSPTRKNRSCGKHSDRMRTGKPHHQAGTGTDHEQRHGTFGQMTSLDVKVAVVSCPVNEQQGYAETQNSGQDLKNRAEDRRVPHRLWIKDVAGQWLVRSEVDLMPMGWKGSETYLVKGICGTHQHARECEQPFGCTPQ